MNKTKPGIERACSYLLDMRRLIKAWRCRRSGFWPRGTSIFRYDVEGCSAASAEGDIIAGARGGCRFTPRSQNTASDFNPSAVEKYSAAIRSATVSSQSTNQKCTGILSPENMQVVKKCLHAKNCRGTMVFICNTEKALASLIDEEIVELRTNGYYIPLLTGSTGHARIVAIACGWEDGKIWVDHQDKSYFRALESECIRMNLQLDVIVYFP